MRADPSVVRTYLSFCADRLGLKISTLKRWLAAITHCHRQAGCSFNRTDGAFLETWSGIRRTHGAAPEEKAPVVTEEMKAIVARLPATLVGVRNRALLLVGFAGAFRRSELCALDVADLVLWNQHGMRILVRQSKTDQESEGSLKDVPRAKHSEFCPVHALRDWLDSAGLEAESLFRPVSKGGRVLPRRLTDQWVARLIKQAILPLAEARAERAWMRLSGVQREKFDKAGWVAGSVQKTVRRYAGQSLRAGFVTSAAAAGARVDEIMDHTGHTRVDTLMRYIRNAREIRTSAAAKLGL